MPTHSKRVDPGLRQGMHQIFSNDTSLSDAVTFATGDYIDFQVSLGRPARKVTLILKGAVDVTVKFNTKLTANKFNESVADTSVTVTEDATSVNSMRIFSAASEEAVFETPDGLSVTDIKLVAYSGAASATTNLTILGF